MALGALGGAVLWLITLKIFEHFSAIPLDANGILLFSWQSIMLLALWPNQRFWTIRRLAPNGREHSIIGIPSDDDLRLINQRTAQRISSGMYD